jgi:CHC2 zinc finger
VIRAVLDHYGVEVADRPGWHPVRCPFHDDEHKSATVCLHDGPRDVFVCHGCGVKGDAIHLIMQEEGVDYFVAKQRAEALARDFGDDVQPVPLEGGRLLGGARSVSRTRRF